MDISELKWIVGRVEAKLHGDAFIVAHTFERDGRKLHVALSERLRKLCKRGKVWKSKAFLTALKNASYGFDSAQSTSPGGMDGIFLLSREYRPKNEMMRKLFDRFLDHPKGEAESVAQKLGVEVDTLLPVRLVSHHMRLLGVLHRGAQEDTLVLVDFDDTK